MAERGRNVFENYHDPKRRGRKGTTSYLHRPRRGKEQVHKEAQNALINLCESGWGSTLPDRAMAGSGSIVMTDVLVYHLDFGYPARLHGFLRQVT